MTSEWKPEKDILDVLHQRAKTAVAFQDVYIEAAREIAALRTLVNEQCPNAYDVVLTELYIHRDKLDRAIMMLESINPQPPKPQEDAG